MCSSFRIPATVDGLSDTGNRESVEVSNEVEAAGDKSLWEWQCSAQLSSLHDGLFTGVP